MKEFGGKLRELIKLRKTSQDKVGKAVDKPQSTVNNWVQGISEPSLSVAGKLAEFLGVSLDYLYNDSITELPSPPTEEDIVIGRLLRSMTKDEAIRRLSNVPLEPRSNRDGEDGGGEEKRKRKSG